MQFSFTEDQLAFRDAVRDLLAKECPPEVVRAAWPEGPQEDGSNPGEGSRADADRVDAVWTALADMGVLGIAVPEKHGGLGMTEVDWILLAEETGYACLPHPFVETACVAAPLLAAVGDPDDLLAGVIGGSTPVAIATSVGHRSGAHQHAAGADRSGVVLTLSQEMVYPPHPDADSPLGTVDPPSGRGGGRRLAGFAGPAVLIDVDPRSLDLEWCAARRSASDRPHEWPGASVVATLDGSRHLVDVSAGGGQNIGDVADAALAFDRGALGVAAQLVGLGRRMLDLSVAYAIERKQFGVPIGSQQAVKHHLADAALQLQFAAPAVYRAAWSLSTGDPNATRDVSMAKAMASDAARLVGRKALQVHGAIGYTVEYDLHLYFKRAEALARSWGDAAWHRSRVADALGI